MCNLTGFAAGWYTLAGNGNAAAVDGAGSSSSFFNPAAVAVAPNGDLVVADFGNNMVRSTDHSNSFVFAMQHMSVLTTTARRTGSEVICCPQIRSISPAGIVSTLAGNGYRAWADGQGTLAKLNQPNTVAITSLGVIVIADQSNNRIRTISPSGLVATLAGSGVSGWKDGEGTNAQFIQPAGVAVAPNDMIIVVEYGNRVRTVSMSGLVSTLAGSGVPGRADGGGTNATFNKPAAVCVMPSGVIVVADTHNDIIRTISTAGMVSALAGNGVRAFADGQGTLAMFNHPYGVACSTTGTILVADSDNQVVRTISPTGLVATLAGNQQIAGSADGMGLVVSFNSPSGIAITKTGLIVVADFNDNRIRQSLPYNVLSTCEAGTSGFSQSCTPCPAGFSCPSGGFTPIVCPSGFYCALLSLTLPVPCPPGYHCPLGSTFPQPCPLQTYCPTSATSQPLQCPPGSSSWPASTACFMSSPVVMSVTFAGNGNAGGKDGLGTYSSFNQPIAVAVLSSGTLIVADYASQKLRSVSPLSGMVLTLAGSGTQGFADGNGTMAKFNQPAALIVTATDNIIVGDMSNNRIRMVTPLGAVSTIAGNGLQGHADGAATSASFFYPQAIAVTASGVLLVADSGNHRLRSISPGGDVRTIAGSGQAGWSDGDGAQASFNNPQGIAVAPNGDFIIADYGNNRIRRVTPSGQVTTIAGDGLPGFSDGTATASRFNGPTAVSVDSFGKIVVTDEYNNRIRSISPLGDVRTIAGGDTGRWADGLGTTIDFYNPQDTISTPSGFFVADFANHRIRNITRLFPFMSNCTSPYQLVPQTGHCIHCPPGTVCPDGTVLPIPCPVGFYCPLGLALSNRANLLQYFACLPGYFCPSGSAFPNLCPIDSFCPAGRWLFLLIIGCWLLVAVGVVSVVDVVVVVVVAAAAAAVFDPECVCMCVCVCVCICGRFQPIRLEQTNVDALFICACLCLIRYFNSTGTGRHLSCPAGTVCSSQGMPQPSLCPSGFYCLKSGQITQCPAGSACPRGSIAPRLCAAGKYQSNTQQDACAPCSGSRPGATTCGLSMLQFVSIVAVSVAVGVALLVSLGVWLWRRWQKYRLRQLAHNLFDKSDNTAELAERRALVRAKVTDLTGRIAGMREIGSGAFGSVMRGRLVEMDRTTGFIHNELDVAVKKPLRVSVEAQIENMAEISLLMSLPIHRNVLSLLGAFTSPDNVVCAVSPFMAGGSLEAQMEAHLCDPTQVLWITDPLQVAIVVHGIFSGLLHLHTHNIMHRDCTSLLRIFDGVVCEWRSCSYVCSTLFLRTCRLWSIACVSGLCF